MREAIEHLRREWLAQQREEEELRALVQVSRAVNSTLDLATVLNQVMDHIIELTGAERAFLIQKLEEHDWNIAATAKAIDTPRSNLYKKLEAYGISQEKDG